jgi:hypothetical protein
LYYRFIEPRVQEALADTLVTLIVSPRRAGPTTLVRKMADTNRVYLTLDDRTRTKASNIIRDFAERVILRPGKHGPEIELVGDIASMVALTLRE